MSQPTLAIGVIGAGSWGTALADLLAKNGHEVRLWAREEDVVDQIQRARENKTFLPGVTLTAGLKATNDLVEAVANRDLILSVVPSQFVSSVFGELQGFLPEDAQVVSASKGIEVATGRRMDEVFGRFLSSAQQKELTFLSGPSFAQEVANEAPTAVVVANGHRKPSRPLFFGFTPTPMCLEWSWAGP